MERWLGRVAIVTGASAGCGLKIAQALTQHGMKVVASARNITAIESLAEDLQKSSAKGELFPWRCDVTKEEEVVSMFSDAKNRLGRVDVCINNAGVAHVAPLLSGSTDQWRNMLEVNVLGVAVCTREAVKTMKECQVDDGQVININSGLGHTVAKNPDATFYSATKFALTALTEGTRNELRQEKSKIKVSQISPNLIATDFRKRMMDLSQDATDSFYAQRPHLIPEDIADAVIYALSTRPDIQIRDVLLSHYDG